MIFTGSSEVGCQNSRIRRITGRTPDIQTKNREDQKREETRDAVLKIFLPHKRNKKYIESKSQNVQEHEEQTVPAPAPLTASQNQCQNLCY